LIATAATATATAAYYQLRTDHATAEPNQGVESFEEKIPSRGDMLKKLQDASVATNPYDVLIIGGGATGAGAVLDAVTRGLKVALIEKEDFAAGASSRSTKLVHGGVRYLEKAVTNLEPGQLLLVLEALHERKKLLDTAPYLTDALPIVTPCFSWWEIPYYWAGLKVYDLLAVGRHLYSSYYLSRAETLRQFPMLNQEGLKGGVVYYDGQMNDARVNVSLAVTAAVNGATIMNHMSVAGLIKDPVSGKVVGVKAIDNISGRPHKSTAKLSSTRAAHLLT